VVVSFAGQEFEWEADGFLAVARLVGRREGDYGIEALALEIFAVELGFA
jgi:hypothetical protein